MTKKKTKKRLSGFKKSRSTAAFSAKAAVDHCIAADYTQYSDHFVAYSLN